MWAYLPSPCDPFWRLNSYGILFITKQLLFRDNQFGIVFIKCEIDPIIVWVFPYHWLIRLIDENPWDYLNY